MLCWDLRLLYMFSSFFNILILFLCTILRNININIQENNSLKMELKLFILYFRDVVNLRLNLTPNKSELSEETRKSLGLYSFF